MTPLIDIGEDNLAPQILDAMDGIRAYVWHGRLVDADGLEAQKAHLDEMKLEFQQAVKFPQRCRAGGGIRCDEVDCGDGTGDRIEFWQQQDSRAQTRWLRIFEEAIHDIEFWKQELDLQRLWMDAAFWASRNGHPLLARRLGHAYRLFYGARPLLNQTASSFAPSGRTVRAVANEIRAKVFGHAVTDPEHQAWHQAQGADCILDNIKDRQVRIYHALEARGLLANPFSTEIGRRLQFAYDAVSFKRSVYEVDSAWAIRIFKAMDAPNLQLAAALMRYYGHFFGTVYLFKGLRIDRPPLGSGHVPDIPTEQQAKRCLFECNRLRAAWISRRAQQRAT